MPKEFISHEAGNKEAWVCVCGNTPVSDGFYTCDSNGNELEPMLNSDWMNLYLCARCGRIIDMDTLDVVGRKPKPELLA